MIFDHDGVLVDSEPLAMATLSELLTASGAPTTVDEAFSRYLGTGLGFVIEDTASRLGVTVAEDFKDEFFARLFERFTRELKAIPNADSLLQYLHEERLPVGIASSGTRERVRLGLDTTGLTPWFEHTQITTIEEVTRGKPHPELFLVAAQKAQIDPSECWAIEDSPFGVQAAKAAGMSVIALAGTTPAGSLSEADMVIDDLSQVLTFF